MTTFQKVIFLLAFSLRILGRMWLFAIPFTIFVLGYLEYLWYLNFDLQFLGIKKALPIFPWFIDNVDRLIPEFFYVMVFFPVFIAISLLPFLVIYACIWGVWALLGVSSHQKWLMYASAFLNSLLVFRIFNIPLAIYYGWDKTTTATVIFSAITVHLAIFLTYRSEWVKKQLESWDKVVHYVEREIPRFGQKLEKE